MPNLYKDCSDGKTIFPDCIKPPSEAFSASRTR